MISLAIVGCAHIHMADYIAVLRARRDDFNVVGVWDDEPGRAATLADQLGCPAVANRDELWSGSASAALVASSTDRHPILVREAIAAQKAMFVEKPLAIDGDLALLLAREILTAGLTFQTGFFLRSAPAHIWLKTAVAEGRFGQLRRVEAAFRHPGLLEDWFRPYRWMTYQDTAGMGGFGDLGIHCVDLLRWIFGPIRSANAPRVMPNPRIAVDTGGTGEVLFAKGGTATISADWTTAPARMEVHVQGDAGEASIVDGTVSTTGAGPSPANLAGAGSSLSLFLDRIAGNSQIGLVDPIDAAAASLVVDGLYRSVRLGDWVDVGDPAI